MTHTLTQNWWLVVLRGLAAVLFGLLTLFMPEVTMATLVLLFGAYALADGILMLLAVVRHKAPSQPRWQLVLWGVVSIIAGVLTFMWPGITAVALLYVIAAWAIVTGVVEIIAAIELRKVITHEWLLGLSGLASVLFGLAIAFWPGAGALVVLAYIAAFAIVFGVLLIALGFRLRGAHQRHLQRQVA
jgi:uncharacterized membrane protein HdeD (DUF308 family)